MGPYTLVRTLPDGTEKTSGPFKTVRAAAVAAAQCLYDNGVASKAEAQSFSTRVTATATLVHSSGYAFRLEPVQ